MKTTAIKQTKSSELESSTESYVSRCRKAGWQNIHIKLLLNKFC